MGKLDQIPKAPDALDAAIARAEQPEMQQNQIALMANPKRPAIVVLPVDISDVELINLMVNIAAIGDRLRANRPSSRLVVVGPSAAGRPT